MTFKEKAIISLKGSLGYLEKETKAISAKIDNNYRNAYFFGYAKDYYLSSYRTEFIRNILDSGLLEVVDFEQRLIILKTQVFSCQRLDKECDVLDHLNTIWAIRTISDLLTLNKG